MAKLLLNLDDKAYEALTQLGFKERRDPRGQAAYMIRRDLIIRGWLKDNSYDPDISPAAASQYTIRGSGMSLEIYEQAIIFLINLGYLIVTFTWSDGDGLIIVDCTHKPMKKAVLDRVGRIFEGEKDEMPDVRILSNWKE